MGNQHSHQLNLKQLNKRIKQKSRINLSLPNSNKNKIKERGSAFLCHSNGCLIANVQFKCNFCSTIKRTSLAIRQHYAKRHHFTDSTEQLDGIEPKNYFTSSIEQTHDEKPKTNCTLFIQDNELIIRCSSLNYGKFEEHEDLDGQRADQIESDLRLKRINELSKLRQELTKLNAFSRLVESAEKDKGVPVRGHSIRLRKFDDDTNLNGNATISNETEDQLNNNHYYKIKSKDDKFKKVPNSASDGSNSSSSSLCQSDAEQTQDLFDDLTKEVEQRLSETSSVDTTFGLLDARCSVCNAKNYVVCIQSRLGKLICAVCFRYFKHFLSEPVVYACEQLGKCDLNKPIKPMSSHTTHSQQKKLSTGTASKYVVKQQQLGIFKSKSNTLQSTPKVRRPLQQKELSFYSIALYSNNNSLSDQSKSMTLNLPSKNYSFKDRLSPANQSNWTTPSHTHSNVSFALKYSTSTNHEQDTNFNSSLNMNNTPSRPARCNACWIKKCIDIYYEVQFDEKIISILNDFHPIQLTNANATDELNNRNQSKSNQQQSNVQLNNPQNTTLIKQKRYYTNNKLKSKSVSRLYYNNATDKSPTKVDQSTIPTNSKNTDHSQTNDSLSESINGSNCSNDSNTTVELNGKNDQSSTKNAKVTNGLTNAPIKANRLSNIPTPSKAKSNGKLNIPTNRSNSLSSNDAFNNGTNKSSKNTITLNNIPFKKSNALSSLNKSNTSKHSSILPGNNLSIDLVNLTKSEQKSSEKSSDYCKMKDAQCCEEISTCDQVGIKSDLEEPLNESEDLRLDQNNMVRLIFKNEPETNCKETNINTIEILNSTENNNLNLLLNTHIHNIPERV